MKGCLADEKKAPRQPACVMHSQLLPDDTEQLPIVREY